MGFCGGPGVTLGAGGEGGALRESTWPVMGATAEASKIAPITTKING